jgi:hypothetical protein
MCRAGAMRVNRNIQRGEEIMICFLYAFCVFVVTRKTTRNEGTKKRGREEGNPVRIYYV